MDWKIDLAADQDVRIVAQLVGEEVQSQQDGSIGRVLEWYDAQDRCLALDSVEDILDRPLWYESEAVISECCKAGL